MLVVSAELGDNDSPESDADDSPESDADDSPESNADGSPESSAAGTVASVGPEGIAVVAGDGALLTLTGFTSETGQPLTVDDVAADLDHRRRHGAADARRGDA